MTQNSFGSYYRVAGYVTPSLMPRARANTALQHTYDTYLCLNSAINS